MHLTQSEDCDRWPVGTRTDLAASPRLFRSPLLDRLSRVHRLVPVLLYSPPAATLLWLGFLSLSPYAVVGGFLAGCATWTLVEYLGHRFLFHHVPKTAIGQRLQFLVHGVHHDYPSDPLRLVMPPLMSLPIMATGFVVLRLACGSQQILPVFAGFLSGYVFYDMLHFHVHHGRPKTRLGRWLRYRHMYHHFRDETTWFGVSAPWWDYIFGTQLRITESQVRITESHARFGE